MDFRNNRTTYWLLRILTCKDSSLLPPVSVVVIPVPVPPSVPIPMVVFIIPRLPLDVVTPTVSVPISVSASGTIINRSERMKLNIFVAVANIFPAPV